MLKTCKFRIYPNNTTENRLQWVLDRCRELYNAALQERKEAYKYASKTISYYEQQNDLPDIKEIRPEYKDIGAHVLQNVLKRVDKTYRDFFRRCKIGQTPGYPRFQGKNRYDSFTYPDTYGLKVSASHVTLPKFGNVKLKLHRPIEGKIKTCTIKHEGEHWYAAFACEVETEKLPVSYEDIGIDLGITHFAARSDGTFIDNPRYYRKGEKLLERRNQALSRKKKGSHRRDKARKLVAKAHRKVRNQRKDFLHKASRQIVNKHQVIVFEDLQTENMVKRPKPKQDENGTYLPNGASAKAGLNKSITDAGWGMFVDMVSYKAASAGRSMIKVNPYKTSQICSACLKEGPHKDLAERTHICIHCGIVLDRDTNAALNILRAGRVQQSAMAVEALGL